MTDILATSQKPIVALDRDFVMLAIICAIGLFASLGLTLLFPGDDVAAVLALMS